MNFSRLAFSLLWAALCFVAIAAETKGNLKIGAFNVQIFGVKKASKPGVMENIVKIIQRYDLILIQEIRDKSQTVMYDLLNRLKTAKTPYRMHISKRLGRTNSKEQYAFLTRIGSGISYVDSFEYDDGSEANGNDTFQREPFVVRFSFQNLPFKYINFIAIHADPNTAVSELQSLTAVYQETLKKWGSEEIVILGDLNADCSYVPKSKWYSIPLRSEEYYWPIEDSHDTTISGTDCAYDRFIIAGKKLITLAKTGKTTVFKFDEYFGLDNTMARLISDHYPIEMDLPTTSNEIPYSASSTITNEVLAILSELLSSECGKKALEKVNMITNGFKNL